MSLDKQQVLKIAHLARLHLEDDEVVILQAHLNDYLSWVEKLRDIDTTGVEPMASVNEQALQLRADKVNDGDCADKILGNAPEAKHVGAGGFFVVPKVVE